MELSKEQEEQLKLLATNLGMAVEKIKAAFQQLATVFIDAWEGLKELAKQIAENFDLVEEVLNSDDKPEWNTLPKCHLKSQVMIRRPLMARARSNC